MCMHMCNPLDQIYVFKVVRVFYWDQVLKHPNQAVLIVMNHANFEKYSVYKTLGLSVEHVHYLL